MQGELCALSFSGPQCTDKVRVLKTSSGGSRQNSSDSRGHPGQMCPSPVERNEETRVFPGTGVRSFQAAACHSLTHRVSPFQFEAEMARRLLTYKTPSVLCSLTDINEMGRHEVRRRNPRSQSLRAQHPCLLICGAWPFRYTGPESWIHWSGNQSCRSHTVSLRFQHSVASPVHALDPLRQ